LNGRDALVYVRSRHSTSDFSRAQRQQQVIKAVIKKLLSTDVLFDI
jgi:anionic cell wall polymer biosynthesis LytR-Cps2A-Psr (LCP) family protein